MKKSTSKNIIQINQENLEFDLFFCKQYVDSDFMPSKSPSTVVNLDELCMGNKSDLKKKKIGKDKRLFQEFHR